MAIKKILKLVNNERKDSKLVSHKSCDATSVDSCPISYDYADCMSYAYDMCIKADYAGCYNYSDDVCTEDLYSCGNSMEDTER